MGKNMKESPDRGQLPYFGAPPARVPKPASEVPALRGKRVILSTPDGFVYDMRAISEVQVDPQERDVVQIVTEQAYFRWMFIGEHPAKQTYPVVLVWVE